MKGLTLRSRLSGAGFKPLHVAAVKSRGDERWSQSERMYLKQVWIREANVSEPSMTRRKPYNCRQNQGRVVLLGQAYRKPDYWAGGGRRIGGVCCPVKGKTSSRRKSDRDKRLKSRSLGGVVARKQGDGALRHTARKELCNAPG